MSDAVMRSEGYVDRLTWVHRELMNKAAADKLLGASICAAEHRILSGRFQRFHDSFIISPDYGCTLGEMLRGSPIVDITIKTRIQHFERRDPAEFFLVELQRSEGTVKAVSIEVAEQELSDQGMYPADLPQLVELTRQPRKDPDPLQLYNVAALDGRFDVWGQEYYIPYLTYFPPGFIPRNSKPGLRLMAKPASEQWGKNVLFLAAFK